MAKKVLTPVQIQLHAEASKMYGKGLWETVTELADGTVSNKREDALSADTEVRKLAGPAMYWIKDKFNNEQIVVVVGDGGWYYAGVIRDKDGDPVISDTNEYEIRDVKARSEYKIVDKNGAPVLNDKGAQVVIQKGFVTTKAYAL